MRVATFLSLTVFSCFLFLSGPNAYSDILDPEEIREYYKDWTEEDKTLFEKVILPSLRHEFGNVVYDTETGREKRIFEKRAAFYTLYMQLMRELKDQNEAPFRQYDHFTKISRSTLRLIMQALASDSESIFYGIHDDVYDDLFADDDGPLVGFRQLTYEPLLSEISSVPVAIPFAIMATALVARALPDRRGRAAALAIAGIFGVFSMSGCRGLVITTNWPIRNPTRVRRVTKSFVRITYWWDYIEREYHAFQNYLLNEVADLHLNIDIFSDQDLRFSERVRRQLFAAVYVTIVENMDRNRTEEDGSPSINPWDDFKENVQRYVTDQPLRDVILSDHMDVRLLVHNFLINSKYLIYRHHTRRIETWVSKISYETVFVLYLPFTDEFDRRDVFAQDQFVDRFDEWILIADEDERTLFNPVYVPDFLILSEAERSMMYHYPFQW